LKSCRATFTMWKETTLPEWCQRHVYIQASKKHSYMCSSAPMKCGGEVHYCSSVLKIVVNVFINASTNKILNHTRGESRWLCNSTKKKYRLLDIPLFRCRKLEIVEVKIKFLFREDTVTFRCIDGNKFNYILLFPHHLHLHERRWKIQ
jgi:hypothetical protein